MKDGKWLKEDFNMTYEELFQCLVNSNELKSILNSYKLSEIAFNVIYSLYCNKNMKSPYDNADNAKDIKYINGDATSPIGEGHKYILHICNDIGGWGKGFVLSLSNKWPETKTEYKRWFKEKSITDKNGNKIPFELGNIQIIDVEEDISVVNMIAQHGIYPTWNNGVLVPPIRYEELSKCINKFYNIIHDELNITVNMPLIGSGLAGGDWRIIENIVKENLSNKGVPTIVHLFEDNDKNKF